MFLCWCDCPVKVTYTSFPPASNNLISESEFLKSKIDHIHSKFLIFSWMNFLSFLFCSSIHRHYNKEE